MFFDRVNLAQLRIEVIHIAAQDSPLRRAFRAASKFNRRTRIIARFARGEAPWKENGVVIECGLLGQEPGVIASIRDQFAWRLLRPTDLCGDRKIVRERFEVPTDAEGRLRSERLENSRRIISSSERRAILRT